MEIIVSSQSKKKTCKCCMCGRSMEAKAEENPPHYCYKCADKMGEGMSNKDAWDGI